MRKVMFSSFIMFSSLIMFSATEKLSIMGFYNGENPIIVNPFYHERFSIEKIEVNSKPWMGDVLSSTIELDLSNLNIKVGDFISLVIYYNNELPKPYVYNINSLQQLSSFNFINPNVDKKLKKVTWKVNNVHGQCYFEVEQYRWDRWVKIAEVKPSDSISYHTYAVEFSPYNGKNLLRIAYVTPFQTRIYSNYIKYTAKSLPVSIVKITSTDIKFSSTTFYQIHNEEGKLVRQGTSDKVNIADLPNGQYFLSYDNQVADFKKK